MCYQSSYVYILQEPLTAHTAQYTEFLATMVSVINMLQEYIVHFFPP